MEVDLEAFVNNKVNVSQECGAAAKKDNSMLGCFKEDITSRDEEVIPLCLVEIASQLEYCVQVWSLLCRKCGQP